MITTTAAAKRASQGFIGAGVLDTSTRYPAHWWSNRYGLPVVKISTAVTLRNHFNTIRPWTPFFTVPSLRI